MMEELELERGRRRGRREGKVTGDVDGKGVILWIWLVVTFFNVDISIYIIYTPNLELEIACFVREREQGRFRGSTEGAGGSIEGAYRRNEPESTAGHVLPWVWGINIDI